MARSYRVCHHSSRLDFLSIRWLSLGYVKIAYFELSFWLHNTPPGLCFIYTDRLGRKPVILAASVVFTIGSIVMGAADGKEGLLAGRIIVGVGIGKENHQMNFNQFPSSPPHWSVCCAVLPVATHMFVSISFVRLVWEGKSQAAIFFMLCPGGGWECRWAAVMKKIWLDSANDV